MRPIVYITNPLNDDGDAVANNQTPGNGDDFLLNGGLAINGVAILPEAQKLKFSSATANPSAILNFTGTDADGSIITESITAITVADKLTTKFYKTVTQVRVTGAAITVNTDIGANANAGMISPSFPVNWRENPFNLSMSAQEVLDGSTLTVQSCPDEPVPGISASGHWTSITGLTSLTDSTHGNLMFGVRLVRFITVSSSKTAVWKFTVIQGTNG